MNQSKTNSEPERFAVLSSAQFKRIKANLPKPSPSSTTTDIQAGFLLGIQYVLQALEDGYVQG